jgi:hypothetical protein
MLNAETFNDVPGVSDSVNTLGTAIGSDITGPLDPRTNFQPPFNKVSRERDPGKINLNTVTGQRLAPSQKDPIPRIWSDVYDGIMHRYELFDTATQRQYGDMNPPNQLAQSGPAWRDVVLSRRGYAQADALGNIVDKPNPSAIPDTFEAGLSNAFPTIFSNPFRSADAGDLVPLPQMMQFGVDASVLRKHPYDRNVDATTGARLPWGPSPMKFGDARDAGFGSGESVSWGSTSTPPSLIRAASRTIPNDDIKRDSLPLFSELRGDAYSDTNRNPYMMYQPMSRLGNLVTDRSGVFAVWITVGYFEVEKAPDWNDSTSDATRLAIRQHFGGTANDTDPATIAALALYNRVYPNGYMLGKEVGSDTGDVKRARGFYIIDRTDEVGFKPGEDLNVEKLIRLRRRIE